VIGNGCLILVTMPLLQKFKKRRRKMRKEKAMVKVKKVVA
jgi:hypothetical protein